MSRLNGRPPKYRQHKRSGRAYVELNGKPVYLGRYGSPEAQQHYLRVVSEWHATRGTVVPSVDRNGGTLVRKEQRRIKAVVMGFWEHAKQHYRRPR